jgi:hypothetical protein
MPTRKPKMALYEMGQTVEVTEPDIHEPGHDFPVGHQSEIEDIDFIETLTHAGRFMYKLKGFNFHTRNWFHQFVFENEIKPLT